jgi:UPF0271 protein
MKIDINSDLGEDFGRYKLKIDESIFKIISSANVACGFHAGDPNVMNDIVFKLGKCNTKIGAHPGFNDLEGFGRRNISLTKNEIKNLMIYQLGALDGFLRINNLEMQHVKPHGALYNLAQTDREVAEAVLDSIYLYNKELIVLGLPNSQISVVSGKRGVRFANEVFADRAYDDHGFLVSRRIKGSVIKNKDLCRERVLEMVLNRRVKSIDGKYIKIEPQSVCIHGDNENSLEIAKEIHEALKENDVEISPFIEICR